MKLLRETVKQAKVDEDLSEVIENYDELEYCFRYSDVSHFANKRDCGNTSSSCLDAASAILRSTFQKT